MRRRGEISPTRSSPIEPMNLFWSSSIANRVGRVTPVRAVTVRVVPIELIMSSRSPAIGSPRPSEGRGLG